MSKERISDEMQTIAAKLGYFFLQEKEGDYAKACDEITRLRINDLRLEDGKLVIETSRPGLLIGRRGERITNLQKHMDMPLHIEETKQHIIDYIYPFEPEPIDDYKLQHLSDYWLEEEERRLEEEQLKEENVVLGDEVMKMIDDSYIDPMHELYLNGDWP